MIALLVFGLLPVALAAGNPGFKLRATAPGLAYGSTIGGEEVTKLITSVNIPPMSFHDGDLTVNLKGIAFNTFSAQSWTYGLQPPSKLSYTMNGGNLAASGDFDGSVKVSIFPAIHVDGHIDASASGARLTVTAQFGRDAVGRPTVSAVGCSCDLGSFNLKLSGNIVADFLSPFHSLIEGAVKPQISQAICDQGKTAINTNLQQVLSNLPTTIDVGAGFSIDYTLDADPMVGSNFVEVQGHGDIRFQGKVAPGIATPQVDDAGVDNARMLNFWGTEYILNTLGASAQAAGVMAIDVNKDAVPEAKSFLATTCSALCVGNIVKEIGKDFPNTYVRLNVKSTVAPVSVITAQNITVSAKGSLDLSVENGTQVVPIATANLDMVGSLVPSFTNNKIMGKIVIASLDIQQTSSTLSQPINWLFLGKLSQNILQNEVNQLLKGGIPLPVVPNLDIVNPAITLRDHTLQLSSDVAFHV